MVVVVDGVVDVVVVLGAMKTTPVVGYVGVGCVYGGCVYPGCVYVGCVYGVLVVVVGTV